MLYNDNLIILLILSLLVILMTLLSMSGNLEYLNVVMMLVASFTVMFIQMYYNKEIATVLLLAYILRVAMAFFYTFFGDPDPDRYGEIAFEMYKSGLASTLKSIPSGAYIYSWFVSIIYSLFGASELMIRIFNAFLSTMVVKYVYLLAKELFGKRVSIKAAKIVAIYPSLIRFSGSFPNREPMILFMTVVAIYMFYLFYAKGRGTYILLSIPLILVSVALHTSMFILFLMLIVVGFAGVKNQFKKQNSTKNSMTEKMLFVFLVLLFLMLSSSIFFFLVARFQWGMEKLNLVVIGNGLETFFESRTGARTAYLTGIRFSNPVLEVLFVPVRVIYFLYTPFIWMVRTPLDMLALFDGVAYFIFTYKAVKTYKLIDTFDEKNAFYIKLLYISLLLFFIIFSIGTWNYGTALRHRAKFFPLLVVLASPSFVKKNSRGTKTVDLKTA